MCILVYKCNHLQHMYQLLLCIVVVYIFVSLYMVDYQRSGMKEFVGVRHSRHVVTV